MSRVVLLRVGIDSGCGGIQGPLFPDGSFEFVCIPDNHRVSRFTYGTCIGRNGIPHSEYFSVGKRESAKLQHVHLDPEFETFTYGDPTTPKSSLKTLKSGDYLVFYCGLQKWNEIDGWSRKQSPALYIIGYFKVATAGIATDFTKSAIKLTFGRNFHVRHPSVFQVQKHRLVLVKGGPESRLLQCAYQISSVSTDSAGRPHKVLSPKMRKIFGNFAGQVSIQRSPPRWVDPRFSDRAIEYIESLV